MNFGARTFAAGKRVHYSTITPQRLAFVHRIIENGGRGTAAAIAAGYAKSSAAVTSVQLLKDDRILALIAAEITRRQPNYTATLCAKRLLRASRPQWLRVKFQMLLNGGGVPVKVIGTPQRPATITSPSDDAVLDHVARHAGAFGLGDSGPEIASSGANSKLAPGNAGENQQNHRLHHAVNPQKKDFST